MQPLAIVPNLDKFKDGGFGFCPGFELFKGALSFQGCVETLHSGVIIAIASPAHAHLALYDRQQLSICFTGVLTTAIGVVK